MDAHLLIATPFLAESALQLSHLLFFAGVTLISISLLHRYRKRHRQQIDQSLTPQEHVEQSRQVRGLRGDLEHLMVEVEQLAKRMGSQLDAKAMTLEQLLQKAEEQIAALEALERRTQQAPTSTEASDPEAPTFPRPVADPAAPPAEAEPSTPADAETIDLLTRRVYAMADAGLAAMDIARQLGEQIGKVELILALRRAS